MQYIMMKYSRKYSNKIRLGSRKVTATSRMVKTKNKKHHVMNRHSPAQGVHYGKCFIIWVLLCGTDESSKETNMEESESDTKSGR